MRNERELSLGDVDFYEIPKWYDILHTPGTGEEVTGLQRIAERYCQGEATPARVWLEPACGTGRYLRIAARRGIRGIGIDLSEPMIVYARDRMARLTEATRPRLIVGDVTELGPHVEASSVDFAFCLINSLRHLPSDRAMVRHLRQVGRSLRKGGVYAVGINTSLYGGESPSEDTWVGTRGTCAVRQVVQYLPPATAEAMAQREEVVISELVIETPTGVEHASSRYTLRTYDRDQWRSVLDSAGMEVLATVDEAGDEVEPVHPGYGVYVLRPR